MCLILHTSDCVFAQALRLCVCVCVCACVRACACVQGGRSHPGRSVYGTSKDAGKDAGKGKSVSKVRYLIHAQYKLRNIMTFENHCQMLRYLPPYPGSQVENAHFFFKECFFLRECVFFRTCRHTLEVRLRMRTYVLMRFVSVGVCVLMRLFS